MLRIQSSIQREVFTLNLFTKENLVPYGTLQRAHQIKHFSLKKYCVLSQKVHKFLIVTVDEVDILCRMAKNVFD